MEQLENIELWASKLQGDWSASTIAAQITRERLQALHRVFPKGKLDNMVKVRVLLACAFLPVQQLAELQPELSALAKVACSDDDEWVRVVGAAVGDLDGRLDMASVCSTSSLVRQTMEGLWLGLADATPPFGYRPLQEVLLHTEVRPAVDAHSIASQPRTSLFRVRDTAEAREALAICSPDNLMGQLGASTGGAAGASMASEASTPSTSLRGGTGRGGAGAAVDSSLFISRPPPSAAFPSTLGGGTGTPRHAATGVSRGSSLASVGLHAAVHTAQPSGSAQADELQGSMMGVQGAGREAWDDLPVEGARAEDEVPAEPTIGEADCAAAGDFDHHMEGEAAEHGDKKPRLMYAHDDVHMDGVEAEEI
uniref:NELF-A N-terminal domain-containing protein n=1 Tax=Chlamydomonas leiostraca TaxID=1034604 RepID=A0A7S0RJ65_9CHLO|mmetsp:Transcript_23358/g.59786  ORF Transcript_23358/g.59786 Transcript_23358/m.59786 type:complete len:366 (+) Transcript_23358:103-1200(+)